MRALLAAVALCAVSCTAKSEIHGSARMLEYYCSSLGGKYLWIGNNGEVSRFQCDVALPEQWISK